MDFSQFKSIIEALLFASEVPLSISRLKEILNHNIENLQEEHIKLAIDELNKDYSLQGRSFEIIETAEGYAMFTKPIFANWLEKLKSPEKKLKLSQAVLETLAIIAYKQPIIKAEIESIRGVDSGYTLKILLENNLIKISGRADVVGHPILYSTTDEFLNVFGLKSLKDLPTIEELKALIQEKEDSWQTSIAFNENE